MSGASLQFASYPQGENPEGAGQVYDAMGGKSPVMGDVLEADNQKPQSDHEHEHSHSNQLLKTHFGAPFGSGSLIARGRPPIETALKW